MNTSMKGKRRHATGWQFGKGLVGCLDHVLITERMADIAIIFPGHGKGEVSLNAHRLILAARSPVFEAMFFGSDSKKTRYIEETEIPPGAFKVLLRYIYTDQADLTAENVLHVLNASEKYKIPSLTEKCSTYLTPILSPEIVCSVLETACAFNLKELQMRCFVYIDKHAAEILQTDGFYKLSREVMARVISRDSLNVEELEVYNAVVFWAELEMKKQKLELTPENRRKTIGKEFALLRIPCMTQQQFADHVVKGNLLSSEEVLQVFLHYTDSGKGKPKFVRTVPRIPGLVRAERFKSSREVTTAWKNAMLGKLTLACNQDMILLGFSVKGLKFKILFERYPLVNVEGYVDLTCGKSKERVPITINCPEATDKMPLEDIYLDKPVLVKKEKNYDLEFNVTFNHVPRVAKNIEDVQIVYTAGTAVRDTTRRGDLEIKFLGKPEPNDLPWMFAMVLSPYSN